MNAAAQLNAALQVRIQRENAFKQEIIDKINAIIGRLAACNRSSSGPAIGNQLDLTQDELRQLIRSIQDTTNINGAESTRIANTVQRPDLRREPGAAVPSARSGWGIFGNSSPPSSPWGDGRVNVGSPVQAQPVDGIPEAEAVPAEWGSVVYSPMTPSNQRYFGGRKTKRKHRKYRKTRH
jgi:hypothetical protein